jgi:hypothetical protein
MSTDVVMFNGKHGEIRRFEDIELFVAAIMRRNARLLSKQDTSERYDVRM